MRNAVQRRISEGAAWPVDERELKRAYQLLHKEVVGLLIEAREQDAFSPVPPKIREAFLHWCQNKAEQIEPVREALTLDLRGPYQLTEMFRVTHCRTIAEIISHFSTEGTLYDSDSIDLVRKTRSTRHQMLGHANSLGSANLRLGRRKVLLAEFSSEASPWMWGDMNRLQYWVELDDLKGRNFDRVEIAIA